MLGMGLTFAAGVGAIASLVAGLVWALPGVEGGPEMFRMVVASAIWSFPIGVAFSGVLAITARGRSFDKLSIPRFAALGSGAGLVFFGLLALNAWQAWDLNTAIVNAAIFVALGGGSATGTLLLARRAAPELESSDEPPSLSGNL
jgi:hypothetical protein